MKVVVLGANGRVGSQVVAELLTRGHRVIACVHGDSRLESNPNLQIAQVDIYDPASVAVALSEADAVVSALGSWGTKRKDVLTEGMKSIIPAAEQSNITRIVSLTGADARASTDHRTVIHTLTRFVFSILAGKVLHDGEEHIKLLEKSSLNWSIVRSPVMKSDGPHTYTLDSKRPMPWHSIPRTAVVQAVCDLVESPDEHMASAPFIHRA